MASVTFDNIWGWSNDMQRRAWDFYKENTNAYAGKDEFWINSQNLSLDIIGEGLKYKSSGDGNYLSGGFVTAIMISSKESHYYFTDISISAATLHKYIFENTNASNLKLNKALFSGDDDITLTFGSDNVFTYGGDDVIRGRSGNDSIDAGSGNDLLCGGTGKDVLNGGSGKDCFVFDTKPGIGNVDTIDDFSVKDDLIVLDHLIYRGIGKAGDLAKAAFHINTTGKAGDTSDRVIYNSKTGALYFDADGAGDKTAVKIALLDAGLKLTSADFDLM